MPTILRRRDAVPFVLVLASLAGSLTPAAGLHARQPQAPEGDAAPSAPAPAQPAPEQPRLDQPPGAPAALPAQPGVPGAEAATGTAPLPPVLVDARGRRADPGEPTVLSFKNVTVEQIVPFIVESTGKVVFPLQEVLANRITLLNDKPLPRAAALDLVFLALQQSGVAVVETQDLIILRPLADLEKQAVPVIGPDESVLARTDVGAIAQKIFALQNASAATVGETVKASVPDYAKVGIDADSNQILVTGPIGLLQRLERVITSLDRPATASLVAETFHLRYADAEAVAQNIRDLFSDSGQAGTTRNTARAAAQQIQRQAQQQLTGQGRGGGGGNQGGNQGGASPAANLRVTSNAQTNSVTVLGEQTLLEQIRKQIAEEWDLPSVEEEVIPRVYELKYTDPIKIKDVLDSLFGAGAQTQVGTQFGQRTTALTPGVGRLAGQFTFQAIPEAGRLIVVAKSARNLDVIDTTIAALDKPISSGMPEIIELKHAGAEDLAEQLNALLAQEGTLAELTRSEQGLSQGGATSSPFAREQSTTDAEGNTTTTTTGQTGSTSTLLRFWWARARVPTDQAGSSNLVGKARVVPVARQNAVMVLAPAEYKAAIVSLIEALDKPGRQVLIAAVIAEITSEDDVALGARFSNTAINPRFQDNAIGIGANNSNANAGNQIISGQQNNIFGSLFDTSVLDIGIDANVILQALAQNTQVRILSEPRIFTGDNIEAEFFDGQDIPFITDSQVNGQGNLVQSFDYRAVGLQVRVRPRITPERDVDLKVNLQLASIQPQQTLFGGFIVDRRETTTQLIIRDGQTVVLSGIMRSEDSDVRRKVPILGDIPLVGALFTSTEKVKSNTELVAFITPIVVNNRAELDSVNARDNQRLQELREQIRPPAPGQEIPSPPK